MTYWEALNSGYRVSCIKWQRKYVSRKVDIMDQPVKFAGGSRKGQPYIELPSWQSTQYSLRAYLEKEDAQDDH